MSEHIFGAVRCHKKQLMEFKPAASCFLQARLNRLKLSTDGSISRTAHESFKEIQLFEKRKGSEDPDQRSYITSNEAALGAFKMLFGCRETLDSMPIFRHSPVWPIR